MPRHRTPLKTAVGSGAADHNPGRFADRAESHAARPNSVARPTGLNKHEKAIWREMAARIPEGVLTAADRYVLEIAVRLQARARGFGEPLKPVEMGHLRACLGSMGMTPADRTKVNGSNEPTQEQGILAAILGPATRVN